MSLPSGVSGNQQISIPTAPTADKASAVQSKIESQVGKISDITAEIAAIMKELQDLSTPPHPGKDASEDELKKYQADLKKFQEQVSSLNKKLDQLQAKLSKAKAVLNKLNNSELPQAQREDAKALQDWTDQSREALEKQAEAAAASTQDSEDMTAGTAKDKVRLQVQQMKRQIVIKDGDVVRFKAVQLAVTVGDAALDTVADKSVTAMPKTPAVGI